MGSALSNFPFVPQNEEQAKAQQDRRDAQVHSDKDGKKCRYIPVRLVELYDPSWRERFGPLKCLRVIRTRIGVGGNRTEISLKVQDGYEFFDWDNQIGQHVAWIYDDPDGYNRSLLASVFFNNQIEIMEKEDREAIEKMAIEKKDAAENNPIGKLEEKLLSPDELKNLSVESIDEQIAFLKKQKKAVLSNQPEAATGEPEKEQKTTEAPSAPPKNRRPMERKSPVLA